MRRSRPRAGLTTGGGQESAGSARQCVRAFCALTRLTMQMRVRAQRLQCRASASAHAAAPASANTPNHAAGARSRASSRCSRQTRQRPLLLPHSRRQQQQHQQQQQEQKFQRQRKPVRPPASRSWPSTRRCGLASVSCERLERAGMLPGRPMGRTCGCLCYASVRGPGRLPPWLAPQHSLLPSGVMYAVDVAIKAVLASQGIKFPGPLVGMFGVVVALLVSPPVCTPCTAACRARRASRPGSPAASPAVELMLKYAGSLAQAPRQQCVGLIKLLLSWRLELKQPHASPPTHARRWTTRQRTKCWPGLAPACNGLQSGCPFSTWHPW